MMKYLQNLGKSLMLPVAVLPAAALLTGAGYALDHEGWGSGNVVSAFLIGAGNSILNFIPIIFAVGVAIGMSKSKDGAAALSGLVGYLVVTTILAPDNVANILKVDPESVDVAFGSIENVFVGIISGLIAAALFNRYSGVKLPDALAFFSGKRLVPILTAGVMLVVSVILLSVWPYVYNALVSFGEGISGLGAIGAGLYGFFNRLLIPTGLHHALNNVFWFDLAGINDIGNFWASEGVKGITGRYQAGFFPIMMFGLPAAALAMYHTAKTKKRKQAASLLMAGALASFLTGVTEPIEFSFMFLAPALYVVHAVLTGLSLFIAAAFEWTAGFSFSAGLIDYVLSLQIPIANMPSMLLIQGLVFAVIYYFLFRFLIVKYGFKTPGREDDDEVETEQVAKAAGQDRFAVMAQTIYEGLGGDENVVSVDNCATRLRLEVKDMDKVDQNKIKSAGVPGINVVGRHNIQVIIGTQVQAVAEEVHKLRKK